MTDPVKNAKVLGVLILISNLFGLLSLSLVLAVGSGVLILMTFLSEALNFIVALGLIMTKKWGVYALGANILLEILWHIYNITQNKYPSTLEVATLMILIFAFVWFHSAIAKFK